MGTLWLCLVLVYAKFLMNVCWQVKVEILVALISNCGASILASSYYYLQHPELLFLPQTLPYLQSLVYLTLIHVKDCCPN